jgi:hypothetical protein
MNSRFKSIPKGKPVVETFMNFSWVKKGIFIFGSH